MASAALLLTASLFGLNGRAVDVVAPLGNAVAGPQAGTVQPVFSPGVADVLKMLDAKVDPEVVKAYIKNSPTAYHPTAEDIVALKNRGVPDDVITAMLNRGAESQGQGPMTTPQPTAPSTPAPAYLTQPSTALYPDYLYDYGMAPSYLDYSYGYPWDYPYTSFWWSYGYPWGFYTPFYFSYYGHHPYWWNHHGYYAGRYNHWGYGGYNHSWANRGNWNGWNNQRSWGNRGQTQPWRPYGTWGGVSGGTRSAWMPYSGGTRAGSFATRPSVGANFGYRGGAFNGGFRGSTGGFHAGAGGFRGGASFGGGMRGGGGGGFHGGGGHR